MQMTTTAGILINANKKRREHSRQMDSCKGLIEQLAKLFETRDQFHLWHFSVLIEWLDHKKFNAVAAASPAGFQKNHVNWFEWLEFELNANWALSISLTFWISTPRARTHLWYHMMDFRVSAMQELVCIDGAAASVASHCMNVILKFMHIDSWILNDISLNRFGFFGIFAVMKFSIEIWFLCFIVIMIILICHSLKTKTQTAWKCVMTLTQLNSSTANFWQINKQKYLSDTDQYHDFSSRAKHTTSYIVSLYVYIHLKRMWKIRV